MLRRQGLIVTSAIFWYLSSSFALAANTNIDPALLMDKFPPSPLEINPPDPLLPASANKKPLTADEQQNLALQLDKLDQEAAATLLTGDKETAFDIWFRELRLRRFLGEMAEVEALSRVGAIAWGQNARPETQYITARLQLIQKQLVKEHNQDLTLWRSLGEAYEKVRVPKLALAVYQQILAAVRQQKDPSAEVETLNEIAKLYLGWFDYAQASVTYQELLTLPSIQGDNLQVLTYLQQLAYIYTQSKLLQQANEELEKIAKIKFDSGDLTQIPTLKLAIAANYQSLAGKNSDLLIKAFDNYQEAYTTAWEQQEYSTAAEALQKLIALYRLQKQIDEALSTSEILVETEQLASNFYGLMQAYDQIGQIYLEQKKYTQALTYFQNGLRIAEKIKYEEAHFKEEIAKLHPWWRGYENQNMTK